MGKYLHNHGYSYPRNPAHVTYIYMHTTGCMGNVRPYAWVNVHMEIEDVTHIAEISGAPGYMSGANREIPSIYFHHITINGNKCQMICVAFARSPQARTDEALASMQKYLHGWPAYSKIGP